MKFTTTIEIARKGSKTFQEYDEFLESEEQNYLVWLQKSLKKWEDETHNDLFILKN